MYCKATKHLARVDKKLARVIREVGPRELVPRRGRYASLCRSIVGQQVSTKAAASVYERFRVACGGWVTPERVDALRDADLRAAGFSRQKVASVRDLTRAVLAGALHLDRMAGLDDEGVNGEILGPVAILIDGARLKPIAAVSEAGEGVFGPAIWSRPPAVVQPPLIGQLLLRRLMPTIGADPAEQDVSFGGTWAPS